MSLKSYSATLLGWKHCVAAPTNLGRNPFASIKRKADRPAAASNAFDYFLALDFESTCDKPITPEPQEIIEFPVLKIEAKTFRIESQFHRYVEPYVNRELSSFCIELTGIVQDMVDGQPHLAQVLREFDEWMMEEGLLNGDNAFAFVTCGDWDLKKMLPSQCRHFGLQVPSYMKSWINIKKTFSDATSVWPRNLKGMTDHLQLPFQGRLHSGIDDCKNIAHILKSLGQKGHKLVENGHSNL